MAASQTGSLLAVLGRLTWMMVGPLALVLATFGIVSSGSGWLTGVDVAYFVILGAMVLGRWLEFRGGEPQTASGEPATPEVLRRFVLVIIPAGLAVWMVANLLGNHWLAG